MREEVAGPRPGAPAVPVCVPYEMGVSMSLAADAILAFAPAGGEGQQSPYLWFFPYLLIFVVFYFLLIAPARKKQKRHQEMLGNLKNGDRVVTNGGILGTVVGVTDDVVQIRIADAVKIEVAKNAVAALQNPPE
jgi:preprotein translocase subunit YajC